MPAEESKARAFHEQGDQVRLLANDRGLSGLPTGCVRFFTARAAEIPAEDLAGKCLGHR